MKQYYIFIESEQLGPLNFDELKSKNISNETLVWFEGLEDWKIAKDIDELKSLFVNIPPPIPKQFSNVPPIPKKETETTEKTIKPKTENVLKSSKSNLIKYGLAGIILLVTIFSFYSYNKNKEESERQNRIYNSKLIEQENNITEQNERIAEQERIEQERIAQEQKKATEKRINEIVNQMNIAYQNLENAKKQLNNATSFKLLRSKSQRNNEISFAEEEISIWKYEIEKLEKEMKRINPNWGVGS